MFSQLGPLFKTAFRQAEASDARLEIRRDEKQEQGRREEREEEEDSGFLWEDKTTVSVESLKAFLIAFLREKGAPETDRAAVSAAQTAESAPAQKPLSTVATRAVKAYTALSPQTPPPPPEPEDTAPGIPLADLLESGELRTMHVLIRELDGLAARGVHDLTIEKADTFLNALVLAVTKAKSGT